MMPWPEPPIRLQALLPEELAQLALLRTGETEIVQRGILFNEGERARALFIILRGEVCLSTASPPFYSVASPGDCVGLVAVMSGQYSMRGETTGTLVVRVIRRTALMGLLEKSGDLHRAVAQYLDAFRECGDARNFEIAAALQHVRTTWQTAAGR